MQSRIFTFDITTACLLAILNQDDDPISVWPPEEYLQRKNLVWLLKRAVYGLNICAEELQKFGFRRLKPNGVVYIHMTLTVIIIVYVDDQMVFGEPLPTQ